MNTTLYRLNLKEFSTSRQSKDDYNNNDDDYKDDYNDDNDGDTVMVMMIKRL